ncbi:glycosyltransferase family 2 protein [Rarobacter incanus]|uniref:Glycosyl transferase family 2 n=1 Tax=Rarobacter incanus TaxID=153494 RepID=A0A542SNT8_9MICO|nr:glycosyltransferase family 2 protein [Rarobacter incanus]TQK76215.1 glycosyl transferase family 2 [Rarobacter incanus]
MTSVPGAAANGQPTAALCPVPDPCDISFIMPVLNEGDYLRSAIDSVLRQQVPGRSELVLALGPSTDNTDDIALDAARSDARIRIVRNPEPNIPAGLNKAILAARYPVVVRVDAHCELPIGYVLAALDALRRTGAANVGGLMHAAGDSRMQRAIARAYNSPLGLGGPAYHVGGQEGPSESAYLGVFRKEALLAVGMYDTNVKRGEDWELNLRLRNAGYLVWFVPQLVVTYRPRASLGALARQFFATGSWRGELARRDLRHTSVRYFAPPLLIGGLAAGVIAVACAPLAGRTAAGVTATCLALTPTALYAAALIAACAGRAGGESLRDRAATLAVLPTMHLSWGAGFWRGFIAGAGGADDTSRVTTTNT